MMKRSDKKPERPPKHPRETLALRRRYTSAFYRDNKGMMALAAAMALMLSLFNLAMSFLLKVLLDISSGGTLAQLIQVLWWCLAALVFFITSSAIQREALPRFLQRAMTQYRQTAFEDITRKSIRSFASESAGTYISALTNDAASVQTNYLARQFSLLIHAANFLGALAMMLYFSPILTGAALLMSLVPVAVSIAFGKRLAAAEKAVSDKNEGFVRQTKDILSGFSVIKSFKAEKEIIGLFCRSNRELEKCVRERRMTEDLIRLFSNAAGLIAQMGVFLVGAWLAVSGRGVTPGVVLIFVQLMNFVIAPISEVPVLLANRKAALSLIDKLADALGRNVRTQGKPVPTQLKTGIEIENLSFGFEDGVPVLHKLSQGDFDFVTDNGPARLRVRTDYPHDGLVEITLGKGDYDLMLLLPGWCRHYSLTRDGQKLEAPCLGGYLQINGPFDETNVSLNMEMPPQRVYAHEAVREEIGKVALQRGPVVYCLEGKDNGSQLHQLILPRDAAIELRKDPEMPGGHCLRAKGWRQRPVSDALYTDTPGTKEPAELVFIPYYAWANRGENEMEVWVREG